MEIQTQKVASAEAKSAKKHELIPDFLIIGAGKCGTTSLDNYLQQHPEILIPDKKEPNFFGYELMSPSDFAGQEEELHHYKLSVTDLTSYLALFSGRKKGQVLGETSNTYLYHEGAADRIKYYNPNMKLIAVLRQPAERLYSRFMHLSRENRAPGDFAACLDRSTVWWKRNDLIKEGFYFKNLEKFYAKFPAENIRVFLYEDFNKDASKVLKEIYSFIGVDPTVEVNTSVRFNESGFIKNKFLNKLTGQKGIVINAAKALLPKSILNKMTHNQMVQKYLNKVRSNNLVKKPLDRELKNRITREIYATDILLLQQLIGKDLSPWLGKEKI